MDNNLIVAVLVGIVVFAGLWLLLRKRGATDVPPAKIEARPVEKASPLVAPAPPAEAREPAPAPAARPAAKPARKPPAAKPVPKVEKPAAKKAAVSVKPAPKKAAAPKKAPAKAAPAAPASITAIGVPGAVGAPDNLLLLKGVGPKLNTLLAGLGITRFDQIGAWSAEDIAKVDAHLGAFTGRIERDSWIEQAGLLARGAIAEFETRFGKLDSEN